MKFQELIQKHNWEDIQAAIIRLYPEYEGEVTGYQEVFEMLKTLKPAPTMLRLHAETKYDERVGEYHAHVSGLGPAAKDGDGQVPFAIKLTDWAEWLSMEISEQTFSNYSEYEIIAHCLWEMTFFGFTQEDIRQAGMEMTESGLKRLM